MSDLVGNPGQEFPVRPDNLINRTVDWIDEFQRGIQPVAFAFAVIKKSGDDRCGQFAALLSYYTFFSLFPLLLVLVTIIGIVLAGNTSLQERLVNTAVARFPVIGDQIAGAVTVRTGGAATIAVGLLVALYAGIGATGIAQEALNTVFNVPVLQRQNFWIRKIRGLVTLVVFGTSILATTALGSVAAWVGFGGLLGRVLLLLSTFLLNAALIVMLFEVLVHEKLGWRVTRWGGLFGGVSWTLLQLIGSVYVSRIVATASRTYGLFAVVIGLLSWIYLQAQFFLFAAEVSSVADRRLFPRALVREHPTRADIDVADLIGAREQRVRDSERAWRHWATTHSQSAPDQS